MPSRAFEVVGGKAQPESRSESLENRVLRHLTASPLSKAELSARLGQKEIAGQLNKMIRVLLGDQSIEYTLPDKPNSRLRTCRLTAKGKALLATLAQNGGQA